MTPETTMITSKTTSMFSPKLKRLIQPFKPTFSVKKYVTFGALKQYFNIVIYHITRICPFQNNRFIKLCPSLPRGKHVMLRLWNRKGNAVKKWRSRAWSIDPKKTNLTIVIKKKHLSQHIPPWIYKKYFASQIA